MEQQLESADQGMTGASEQTNAKLTGLREVNVDQAAIDEAREAVGDDEDKIREYLISNRGLIIPS